MRYIYLVNEHIDREAVQVFMTDVVPEAKDAIMTLGQQLIEQGLQQGIQQGRQQGRQEGIQEGVQQGRQEGVQEGESGMLLRLLRKRFADQITLETEQRITAASREQLAIWSDRVLSAGTLHDLLAD